MIGLYALHRFDDARVTLLPALIPEDFSLEDFVRRANFEGKRGRTVRLTVVTDSPDLVREILESPLCATQEASVDPDSTDEAPLWRVVAVLEDSALLDAWLAQRRVDHPEHQGATARPRAARDAGVLLNDNTGTRARFHSSSPARAGFHGGSLHFTTR